MLCTLALARSYLRGLRNYQLGTVARELGVRPPARLHRAAADSMLVQGIATRLLGSLPVEQVVVELRRVCPARMAPEIAASA